MQDADVRTVRRAFLEGTARVSRAGIFGRAGLWGAADAHPAIRAGAARALLVSQARRARLEASGVIALEHAGIGVTDQNAAR